MIPADQLRRQSAATDGIARVNGRRPPLLKEIGQFLWMSTGNRNIIPLRVNQHLGLLDRFSDLHEIQILQYFIKPLRWRDS
jgi:hypothetical protein